MRTHGSPKGGRFSIRTTSQSTLGCSWHCSGMAALWSKFPPTLSLHVSISKEKFLTLQEFCLCPCPGLECPPRLSPEGLLFLRTGSESSAPTKHPTGSHWLMLGCLATKTFSEPLILVCRYKWPDVLLESESRFSLLGRPQSA